VHADQVVVSQLVHARVLQACDWTKIGQPLPPFAAAIMTERDCVCTPPAHDLEHADQSDHDETTQSTGHACVLHAWDCDRAGHGDPPFAAATTTVRVCVCMPPAHDLVHVDQALQPETEQWTGHAWVLHACCWESEGHVAPPFAGETVTERVWIWTPPPHEAEQADHVDHVDTAQLTGHAWVLHACD